MCSFDEFSVERFLCYFCLVELISGHWLISHFLILFHNSLFLHTERSSILHALDLFLLLIIFLKCERRDHVFHLFLFHPELLLNYRELTLDSNGICSCLVLIQWRFRLEWTLTHGSLNRSILSVPAFRLLVEVRSHHFSYISIGFLFEFGRGDCYVLLLLHLLSFSLITLSEKILLDGLQESRLRVVVVSVGLIDLIGVSSSRLVLRESLDSVFLVLGFSLWLSIFILFDTAGVWALSIIRDLFFMTLRYVDCALGSAWNDGNTTTLKRDSSDIAALTNRLKSELLLRLRQTRLL